jgi:hypothetical protein
MEETVWIAIGIISILIVFGTVAGFFKKGMDEDKLTYSDEAVRRLGEMCNKVCLMPDETYLYVETKIPSGIILNSRNDSICMEMDDNLYCSRCQCMINKYTLDLNNTEALKLFKVHDYRCFFLNNKSKLTLDCKG